MPVIAWQIAVLDRRCIVNEAGTDPWDEICDKILILVGKMNSLIGI